MGQVSIHPDPQVIIAGLTKMIRDAYGISLVSVVHMPVGFVGIHYQAYDRDGQNYFITIYDGSRVARFSAERLYFSLPTVHYLQQSGQFTELAAPIMTLKGKFWFQFMGQPVVLYPFIAGHLLAEEDTNSEGVQSDLGRLAARLHQAQLYPQIENPIMEQFTFHFEEPLLHNLEILARQRVRDSSKTALRDLLLPHKEKIHSLVVCLHELAVKMQRISPTFVICHTDIHPWNVIRKADQGLVLIDWEGIILAPAEHDLFIFTGPGFDAFLKAYYAAGGKRNLTATGFAFYFYRRNLEDLTDFIVRILDENGGLERDHSDLVGIQEDCISGWPELETAEERMRIVLEAI